MNKADSKKDSKKGSKKGRAKGSGYIFKRGSIYYLEYKIKGKRKVISLKCKSKRKADEKADNLLKPVKEATSKEEIAVHIGKARKILKEKSIPLDSVWKLYLKNSSRPDSSEGTLGNYERMWNKFKKWLESNYPTISSLSQINEDICQEYGQHLWKKDKDGNGLSANTYNYHIQALKLVCRILKNEAGFDINPFDVITKKSEDKQSRKELTEEEVLHILEFVDDKSFHLLNRNEMKVMFNFGAWTGLRLIDCAKMRWQNIDFKRNVITCIPQKTARKTGKLITIPIHPMLKGALNDALKWKLKGNDYVLPQVAERYDRNSNGVKKDVVKVFDKAGFNTTQEIKGIQRKRKTNIYGFHSFRHSFVSFCAKAGVPLPVVQSIVGHGNPAITRHYVHIGEENIKSAIKALPANDDNKKTSEEKIEEILKILNEKKRLTKAEKEILKVVKD